MGIDTSARQTLVLKVGYRGEGFSGYAEQIGRAHV